MSTEYPKWQMTIRAAQAKVNGIEAEKTAAHNAAKVEAQRKEDAKNALALKRVLQRFGIEADPIDNTWAMPGGYVFAVQASEVMIAGEDRAVSPEVATIASFRLVIRKPKPQGWRETEWRKWPWIELKADVSREGWEPAQARLANYLDWLDEKCDEAEKSWREDEARYAEEAKRESEFVPATTRPPTKDEQLVALIREIVREAMEQ